ncbi:MAG: C39 family peptidase [Oscillospiraceae bacterium]|nr:C39 family peptidase [Oscillospiraceae bacterium]
MKPHKKKTFIIWLFLLAAACIAAVELIACRFFDPDLFHTITDPVVHAVTSTADAVGTAAVSAVHATGQAIDGISRRIHTAINDARAKHEAEKQQQDIGNEQELSPAPEEPENQRATAPLLNIPPSICDPSVTELRTIGEREVLTGGPVKVVCYLQSDERWGKLKYGSDKISTHGCGPTAMAMVVSSMTDTVILPQDMAQWAVDNGHWARRSGSYHSIVIDAAGAFGLHAEGYPLRDVDVIREELMSGNLFVALMGPGHFTQSGHFIILRGVTLSGDILIADPGSLDRSLTAWDLQLILDELSKSTADGSPLWIISKPKDNNPA